MEHRGSVSFLWPLYASGLVVLLGIGLLALWDNGHGALELSAARGRWATRPFARYRLDLEYGALGYCRQSVEVEGQRVVAVLRDTCSAPAPTVDELFDRIERDIATISGSCGPNGCGCDGTIVVSAAYDPQLGFPRSKRVYLNPQALWSSPDYWKRRLSGQLCTSLDFGRDVVKVVSLTPMT